MIVRALSALLIFLSMKENGMTRECTLGGCDCSCFGVDILGFLKRTFFKSFDCGAHNIRRVFVN
jgi:hypothetical protein